MGLGKTPIAIACAEELLGCRDIDCALIVCSATLKLQWAQRIAEFTDLPGMNFKVKDKNIIIPKSDYCRVINGTPDMRKRQYQQIAVRRPEYVIMGYENVVNDARFVRNINPGLVVIDECTAIKTFRAKRTRQIKKLLNSEYRIGLTGTPVENKPEELFSIMEWVDAAVLGRFDLFDRSYIKRDHFGRVKSYRNLPVLRNRMLPAIARKSRLDPEVAPYLPDVDHGTWSVTMPPELSKTYKIVAADLLQALHDLPATGNFDLAAYYTGSAKYGENSALGNVMARQMVLEMLLDYPGLVDKSARDYDEAQEQKELGAKKKNWAGSKYASELVKSHPMPQSTPKLDYLREVVPEILDFDERNKILIFTRFVGMLDVLSDHLSNPYVRCVKFHGGMNPAEKAATIAQFSEDKNARVFLSSHAGAYGNDMHMANYLINYDLPWSAGKADQINGRHVRASSQFNNVFIRDMVIADSVEERRQHLLTLKRKVGSAILDGHGQDADGAVVNDLKSLMSHLTDVLGLS